MSRFVKFCSTLLVLSLFASALPAGEDAPAVAEPTQAEPGKADAPVPAEKAAAPRAEPTGPLAKLPVTSDFFDMVFDSIEPEDSWENNAIQQIEMQPAADILTALKASTHEHLANHVSSDVKYKELMKTPEKFRGQVVQVRGLLETFQKFPIPENKSGEVEIWRGQISNIHGQIYTFFSLDMPDKDLTKKPVRLTGVFLKRYAYKNRLEGEKLTWTPAIFVRNVEAFSENDVYKGKSPMSGLTALIIAVLVLLVAARIGYKYVVTKNKPQTNYFTKMRRRKEGVADKFPRAKPSKVKPDEKPATAESVPPETPPNPEAGT
jgi:hypothetical protein